MTRLPEVSGHDCVNALAKVGFYFKRQEGSHIVLRRDEPFAQVVANHRWPADTHTQLTRVRCH